MKRAHSKKERVDESLDHLISALAKLLDIRKGRIELVIHKLQLERLKEISFKDHKNAGGLGCIDCFNVYHSRAHCPRCGRKLSNVS